MKLISTYSLFLAMIACFLPGCQKAVQDPHPPIDVVYSAAIDGYSVHFNNTTAGGVSYKWEFGDGTSSTEKSPTHLYPGKGKYVPTLYVTTAGGAVLEGATVLRISKTSSVKLTDNSFADWDTIKTNAHTFNIPGNIAKTAKFDYDATSVYFYFELQGSAALNPFFDFYLDADANPSGYDISGYFTGAGVDVLMEGQVLDPAVAAPDLFYYIGPGWNWSQQSISGFFQKGTVKTEGGLVKIEGRIDRTKIKGLAISTAMKLGIVITKSDWSAELGHIPGIHSAAIAIDMSE